MVHPTSFSDVAWLQNPTSACCCWYQTQTQSLRKLVYVWKAVVTDVYGINTVYFQLILPFDFVFIVSVVSLV